MLIYQVFIRTFGNHADNLTFDGTLQQNGCAHFEDFDVAFFNHMKTLNVSHVWYTGVIDHLTHSSTTGDKAQPSDDFVKGKAGSPYAIKNYFKVTPYLGSEVSNAEQEFDNLISKTKTAGLGSIIDFIPNHVARNYKSESLPVGIRDLGADDDKSLGYSQENCFYYLPNTFLTLPILNQKFTEIPAKATGNDIFSASPTKSDWYETIKLNYGIDYLGQDQHLHPNIPVWQFMRSVLLFWLARGVNGFRCDMAEMVPQAFWHWVIAECRAQFPEAIFIAEIYKPDICQSYIDAGFNYLYDKVETYDAVRHAIEGKVKAAYVSQTLYNQSDAVQQNMLRFLENHDEQRIASSHFAGNGAAAFPGMASSMLSSNAADMIYNGQEIAEPAIGKSGYSGDDGRSTIFDFYQVPSLARLKQNNLTPSETIVLESYRAFFDHKTNFRAIYDSVNNTYHLDYCQTEALQNNCHFFLRFDKMGQNCLLICANYKAATITGTLLIPFEALTFMGIDSDKTYITENLLHIENGKVNLANKPKSLFDIKYQSSGISFSINLAEYGVSVFNFITVSIT